MKIRQLTTSIIVLGLAIGINTGFAAPASGLTIGLSVKDKLEKDKKTKKEKRKKTESRSTTEKQIYELSIQVANTSRQDATIDLEWYFLMRPYERNGKEGDPAICEKGKKTMSMKRMQRLLHKVASAEISGTETKSSTTIKDKEAGTERTTESKSGSGASYVGYIVVVRHEGTILNKKSNKDGFLTDEWLAKLDGPVKKAPNDKAAGSKPERKGKGKGKRKRK